MNIALLAFKFHPYEGVGANRWNNIAQNLVSMGHNVTVFTVKWRDDNSPIKTWFWHGVKIVETRTQSPELQVFDSKIIDMLSAGVTWITHRIGLNYDEAITWEKPLLKFFILEHSCRPFDVLVATGAPFSVLNIAGRVGTMFPKLLLVLDFRDPFWSSQSPRPEKRGCLALKTKLKSAVNRADLVTTVSPSLALLYKEIFAVPKVLSFTNGFNSRELSEIRNTYKFNPFKKVSGRKVLTLVHTGNLTNGRQNTMLAFFKFLSANINRFDNKSIEVTNIGYVNKRVARILSRVSSKITFKTLDRVPKMESLSEILNYHACIHVCSQNTPFALSTKVFEYIGLHRPILSINYGGEITNLLEPYSNTFLINFRYRQSSETFDKLIGFLEVCHGKNSNIQNYDYQNITEDFLKELELAMKTKQRLEIIDEIH